MMVTRSKDKRKIKNIRKPKTKDKKKIYSRSFGKRKIPPKKELDI